MLSVEEQGSLLGMIRHMLGKQRYRLLAAATSGEALRLVEAHAGGIHRLITDVALPEMNGWDFAECLLAFHPSPRVAFMYGFKANVMVHQGILL